MREKIVNESFGYDPITAVVNATRMNAETDGGSTHLDLRRRDVARFVAEHTEASEADALTAIEHAVEDGFLTETEAGTIHIPRGR